MQYMPQPICSCWELCIRAAADANSRMEPIHEKAQQSLLPTTTSRQGVAARQAQQLDSQLRALTSIRQHCTDPKVSQPCCHRDNSAGLLVHTITVTVLSMCTGGGGYEWLCCSCPRFQRV